MVNYGSLFWGISDPPPPSPRLFLSCFFYASFIIAGHAGLPRSPPPSTMMLFMDGPLLLKRYGFPLSFSYEHIDTYDYSYHYFYGMLSICPLFEFLTFIHVNISTAMSPSFAPTSISNFKYFKEVLFNNDYGPLTWKYQCYWKLRVILRF